ncbi:MAG TPA: hypothetical protein VGK47_14535, partial [Nitrososphaeraceae archaeon]
ECRWRWWSAKDTHSTLVDSPLEVESGLVDGKLWNIVPEISCPILVNLKYCYHNLVLDIVIISALQ